MKDGFIPIRKAVEITGLHPNTLRKYADSNKVQSYTTPAGQRMFNQSNLQKLTHPSPSITQVPKDTKKSFIYARVSSKKQHDDLHRQIQFLQTRKPEYAHFHVIQDIASGINFQRKGLQTILDSCLQGTLGEVVIAHKDRLARFGFDILKYIIERSGGTITIVNTETTSDFHKSSEQELAEDLLSIVHIYSCKQMGKRSYATRKTTYESTENTIKDK